MKNFAIFLRYTALLFFTVIFLVPIFYVIYNSFLPNRYVQTWVPPSIWTLDNYKRIFADYPVWRWYGNTLASTVIVVLGNLIFTTMSGYAMAKLKFPGREVIFNAFLGSMMVPFQLVIIQLYIQLAQLQLHNTIWSITLPFLSQTMFIFISRQFFFSVPGELIEAARIDGLSHAGAFYRVVMPNAVTLFTTIAILNFNGTWNSYLVPSTFINIKERLTLVVGLQMINQEHFIRTSMTLAGIILLSFPVMLFFLFTQKYFVQGVMASGIKG
ncbi:MAG: carbohydrate ABC transporter permease [Treponema sp.]|jgi:multiple sugar transport system permease protein|nr:carbohydrate ABC transporter permease [Treponema sp.]